MCVLREEEALKTPIFHCSGKLPDINAIISGKVETTYLHSLTFRIGELVELYPVTRIITMLSLKRQLTDG
jgi:hypothetical protein